MTGQDAKIKQGEPRETPSNVTCGHSSKQMFGFRSTWGSINEIYINFCTGFRILKQSNQNFLFVFSCFFSSSDSHQWGFCEGSQSFRHPTHLFSTALKNQSWQTHVPTQQIPLIYSLFSLGEERTREYSTRHHYHTSHHRSNLWNN